jgi:hypothetical protein
MTVVYKLPDLPRAARSDVGDLARRLIEHADLSAVVPLVDALRERSVGESQMFLREIAKLAVQKVAIGRRGGWGLFVNSYLLPRFWFDLFDLTETLAAIEKRVNPVPQAPNTVRMEPTGGGYARDIEIAPGATFSAGDPVFSDEKGRATNTGEFQVGTAIAARHVAAPAAEDGDGNYESGWI